MKNFTYTIFLVPLVSSCMQPAEGQDANPLMSFVPLIVLILIIWLIVRFIRKRNSATKDFNLMDENVSSSNTQTSPTDKSICKNCGKPIKQTSKFCNYCGTKQD